MKYFLDTEFLEGTQRHRKSFLEALFATKIHTPPTIDLISIGIVAEDSREYYAISKDFNLKEAWNRYDLVKDGFRDCGMTPIYKKVYWIRDNVLKPIFIELRANEVKEYNIAQRRNIVLDFPTYSFCFREFKRLLNKYGKTNKQIAKEIKEFVGNPPGIYNQITLDKNQFYGYFADYDWVVFCWLFGRMVDLPKGFPMYCIDLKQSLDEVCEKKLLNWEINLGNFDMLTHIKTLPNYPKQTNEHNALADARWNRQLYNFLNTL